MSSNTVAQTSSDGTSYILSGPGNGKLVLCIHGIGGAKFQFDDITSALNAQGFRVLRYDLMGRGDSAPAETYTGEAHVAQILRLLGELGMDGQQMHVVAHSMGGALAALFAEKYDKVDNIVLLSPAGLMDLGPLKLVRKMKFLQGSIASVLKKGQESAWRQDFIEKKGPIAEGCVQKLKEISQRNPKAFDAFFSCALVFPLSGLESTVQSLKNKRVFILWGEKDKAVPMKPSLKRWQKVLPSASVKTYPKSAHGFFMELPSQVNADVLSFLTSSKTSISGIRNTSLGA